MTAAPGRGQRPLRVGNCSGFYGDRASGMADMAEAGGIDVLTGDYLAEVTMLILGKARAKDPTKGYAATFLQHLDTALAGNLALSAEVTRLNAELTAARLQSANLLAAIRATIAAHADGESDPLYYLRDELDARQMPAQHHRGAS